MTADIKTMINKIKSERLLYAASWLGFILFILVFIFDEYQQTFFRALFFIAGFIYAKHFAQRRGRKYIDNYKLPDMPYEPGKFLDYKKYKKAFPNLTKIFIILIIGIALGAIGLEESFYLFIYLGPLITGIGIGELVVHFKMKKEIKSRFNLLMNK